MKQIITLEIDDSTWPYVTLKGVVESVYCNVTQGPSKHQYDLVYSAAEVLLHNLLSPALQAVLHAHGK